MANINSDRPSLKIPGEPISELPWSADFVMQAIELLPVSYRDGELVALKPDCADSFIIGWPAGARPEDVAAKAIEALGMRPVVLHSTSWRHSGNDVVLTYLIVVAPDAKLPDSWLQGAVAHAELARGDAITPPPIIRVNQVLEHALRHLCWLVREDEQIGAALPGWHKILESYVPEPFRALGSPV